MSPDDQSLVTQLLHHRARSLKANDAIAAPLSLASTYLLPGTPSGTHQYGRWSNPTWQHLEEALSHLEQAQTLIFPSGMAAITAVLMTQLRQGDRLLIPADGYYTTRSLAERYLVPRGISVDVQPTRAFESCDLASYKMVFVETPANPTLDIVDLAVVAGRAKAAGAILVADNTTMTPLGQRPIALGAAIVVSSDTKTVSGHSDVVFGHVASGNSEVLEQVGEWRKLTGSIPGPFEAWLVLRSLETLELRFERMCSNAQVIAQRLANHSAVAAIRYPGLEHDAGHAVARKQMSTFGSVIGLTLRNARQADEFIGSARFIVPSTSFGGIQSSAERRARWGDDVAEGFVRLSVGCEPVEPLWSALDAALAALT